MTSEIKEWQIVRDLLRNNPAGKNPKEVASHFNYHLTTVYKWGEDPENAYGKPIPKALIIPLSLYVKDARLLDYYARKIGYTCVPVSGDERLNGEILDNLFHLDSLRGKLAEKLEEYLGDQMLSQWEILKLIEIAENMYEELQIFIKELKSKLR